MIRLHSLRINVHMLCACAAGEHVIEVLYLGKPIAGSPFHCQVFDWAKISVSKLPHNTVTDRPIDFDSKQSFFAAVAVYLNFKLIY